MRVWQPGGHLMAERGSKVDDWSWRSTHRRLMTLARLAAPYKTRTILSVFALFAATVTALAPPFLSKYAVDYGIRKQDLAALTWIVAIFLLAGLADWGMSYAQTYLTGWSASASSRTCETSSSATCSISRSASSSATGRASSSAG